MAELEADRESRRPFSAAAPEHARPPADSALPRPDGLAAAALVAATALLAWSVVHQVHARVGHPAAPLDDTYIHLQYARAIAEGHPFRYFAGEPISTGATSFVWPMLLAPFALLGFRDEALLWPAWALGFAALGALAWEIAVLTRPLAGRACAMAATGTTLLFGGLVWCAASGMEVVPFAWLVARACRRAAEWAEAPESERSPRRLRSLLFLAVLLPLARPEGAVFALALAIVVATSRASSKGRAAAAVSPFVIAAFGPQILLLLLTGSPTSSTAQVKLLAFHPYLSARDAFVENVRLLFGTLLNGEIWSAEFLPSGGAAIAVLGLVACAAQAVRTKHVTRGALVLAIALTMLAPCAYVTFLWNRLRYLMPFAPGWIVGIACLARLAGDGLRALRVPSAAAAPPLLAGVVMGLFASKLGGVVDDVAQSASGIDRQQVTLGRWANGALPRDARIGVNDTGAIAYFGHRRTFDVVGLTTPGEGRYWVAGPASRYEHYERLGAADRSRLPTHFIVYPEWMACDAVLGRLLDEAVVRDATILGGQVMRAYEARWDVLGSGEAPWTAATVIDGVDVADLESEGDHHYALAGTHDGEEVVAETRAPDGARTVVDGGRTNRTRDAFDVQGRGSAHVLARVAAHGATRLRATVAGHAAGERLLEAGEIVELAFDDVEVGARASVTVEAEGAPFTAYHYWLVAGSR